MAIEYLASLPWMSMHLHQLSDVMMNRPSPDLSFLFFRQVDAGVNKCLLQLLIDIFSVVERLPTVYAVEEIRLAA